MELFLVTDVVRMIFCSDVSNPFSGIRKGAVSGFSADVTVPRLCSPP